MRCRVVVSPSGRGLMKDAEMIREVLTNSGIECGIVTLPVRAGRKRKWWDRIVGRFHSSIGPHLSECVVRWMLQRGRRKAGHDPELVNIFLQNAEIELLPTAGKNVLIPNQEWFNPRSVHLRRAFDRVLCKTADAERIFAGLGFETRWVGFTSFDQYAPDIAKEPNRFLHLAGNNQMRGTRMLVQAWSEHPDWPTLHVHQEPALRCGRTAANVRYLDFPLDEAELRRQLNRTEFLVFPSEAEGYGHSLVEAMSACVIPITTNAAPMNELVTPQRGLLCDAVPIGNARLATRFAVVPSSLEVAIETALKMPQDEKRRLGAAARVWFLANDQRFRLCLPRVLQEL